MNYYYDLEFLEGKQDKRVFGIKYGETKNTIDVISIGIVSEDNREYYAISKDFNLKEAWNRWDGEFQEQTTFEKSHGLSPRKKYWIRENVLKPIYYEWISKDITFHEVNHFTYKNFKELLKKYGKTSNSIAKEIKNFCYSDKQTIDLGGQILLDSFIPNEYPNNEFYGYYSAYDHVALCWLFGRMIDLPKGFPMFTIDLKQILDERASKSILFDISGYSLQDCVNDLKQHSDFPKQNNEHNALSDARWNKQLHEFLKKIIDDGKEDTK